MLSNINVHAILEHYEQNDVVQYSQKRPSSRILTHYARRRCHGHMVKYPASHYRRVDAREKDKVLFGSIVLHTTQKPQRSNHNKPLPGRTIHGNNRNVKPIVFCRGRLVLTRDSSSPGYVVLVKGNESSTDTSSWELPLSI